MSSRQPQRVGIIAHWEATLGREYDTFGDIRRPAGEPAADDLLRLSAAIDVGGINQSAASVDKPIELVMGAGFIGLDAEGHGSEAERRYGASAAAESAIVHVSFYHSAAR